MKRSVLATMLLLSALLLSAGCAHEMNAVNKGAKEIGRTGGSIMRIPHSVSEGISEGISGEPESNPYNR